MTWGVQRGAATFPRFGSGGRSSTMLPCLPLWSERGICSLYERNDVEAPDRPHNQAMNEDIWVFLDRLDEALIPFAKEGEHFDMYHLGRSALVIHHGFRLSTSDIDVVGRQNPDNLEQKAIEL